MEKASITRGFGIYFLITSGVNAFMAPARNAHLFATYHYARQIVSLGVREFEKNIEGLLCHGATSRRSAKHLVLPNAAASQSTQTPDVQEGRRQGGSIVRPISRVMGI